MLGLEFEKDEEMDDCPNCSVDLDSAQHRLVAKCSDCGFVSFLNPVGLVRVALGDST